VCSLFGFEWVVDSMAVGWWSVCLVELELLGVFGRWVLVFGMVLFWEYGVVVCGFVVLFCFWVIGSSFSGGRVFLL